MKTLFDDILSRSTPFLVSMTLAACAGRAPAESIGERARSGHCRYDATLLSAEPALLEVAVACDGPGFTGVALADPSLAAFVHEATITTGRNWLRASYRVDLEGMARDSNNFDRAIRVGESVLAPVSSWLMHPAPLRVDVPTTVRVHGVGDFATGLRRGPTGGTFVLQAHEIPVGTYSIFGTFAARTIPLEKPGQDLSLVVLDGELDVDLDTLESWVTDAARAVSSFWQGFPDEQALVTIVPMRGRRGVIFGKVLPESAPGIVIQVGEHTTRQQLHDDWILVHELFHIGFPSFHGEGKWLDEGLATYFEPIIRARAGFIDEREVWEEFMRAMPQGLPAVGEIGLERGDSYRDIYWGGAVYCLLADTAIRDATGGKAGLEQGLHAIHRAGGHSSEVWSLSKTLNVADAAIGIPILDQLARSHAYSATPVDLEALWARLGVVRTRDGAELDEGAPLAAVRRAIVAGNPASSVARR